MTGKQDHMVRRFVASENENDRVVCANVFGLRWSTKLLALMECAARSSYLVMQPWKAFPVYRFRERRVRPLCHLIVRQQTWQKIINSAVAAGLSMWESRMRFPSLASARRHLQA